MQGESYFPEDLKILELQYIYDASQYRNNPEEFETDSGKYCL